MALDIRGSLKNTKINQQYYVVFDELLSNSLDSYLIRKNQEPSLEGLKIGFSINFYFSDLQKKQLNMEISCKDNGAGLAEEQRKAFVTKDTSYKDDLKISGIAKCKGSGRIQYLHYFSKLKINSKYRVNNECYTTKLDIDANITKEIDEQSFAVEKAKDCSSFETTVVLDNVKPEIYKTLLSNKDINIEFSPERLKGHILISFLQRLVSLRPIIGNFTIDFEAFYDGAPTSSDSIDSDDLPERTNVKEFDVVLKNLKDDTILDSQKFVVSHYKLKKSDYLLKKNTVAFCAKSSIVKVITGRYLKNKTLEHSDIKGFYHIVLIESDYLDTTVNEQRNNFDLPETKHNKDAFEQELISFEEIYDLLDDLVCGMLEPPDWDKSSIVQNLETKYGISSKMVVASNVRIHFGETEDSVVKRVLASYQEQIINDTSEMYDIKEEIINADPSSDIFREKINELTWKYTSCLEKVNMANLSQLVVRRAAILEILSLAIKRELRVQDVPKGVKRQDESIIHNIFFPRGKDSEEISDHDIWILNEEYHYYDYIVSDKKLSKLKLDDEYLFEPDVDEELQKILEKNYKDNDAKRPDIAIFNKAGSVVIIEFKAPGVFLDEHVGDLMEYAQLLAAKSKGKLKKFYGYLIGTDINANRIIGFNRFSDGKGWFNTLPITQHSTGARLGELYYEILYYDDIVYKAQSRLAVYEKKLGLEI